MPFDQENYVAPALKPSHPAPPATDEVLSTLIKARAVITDPSRWTQGGYECGYARCILGAIRDASPPEPENSHAGLRHKVGRALVNAFTTDHHHPQYFNDDPETTHADVLALFDRAISTRRAELKAGHA